ncbi:MAG: ABC transporter ATP-binding protein [Planctomycetes bacterium]|nr:ABC transporter ATP-binding protein [Planctomycetota bacterium]
MLELERVTKLYGPVIGINDVTLSLPPGGYGLLGPNGAGKTTLINLVTGQLRPTLGRVRTLGRDPWNCGAVLRRIGLCPSTTALLPAVSGLDWVAYLLELQGIGRSAARERARRAMRMAGMEEAMERRMGSYSKGMRQRTKLAQALAHEPDLLILDEPFDGLDPVGRHEMTERLREWMREGRSLLLASHILHEVEAVAPSFLLICSGRLLASGSAEEVRALLADVPAEIRIRCDRPADLSSRMLESGLADGARLEAQGALLVLSTKAPLAVYERLPEILEESGIRATEIISPDESLQSLFDSLLRIHRGEAA